jgi:uncharacterized integral membrane protein
MDLDTMFRQRAQVVYRTIFFKKSCNMPGSYYTIIKMQIHYSVKRGKRAMATFKFISFLTILAVVAGFVYGNATVVPVKFFGWEMTSMSLSLLLLAVLFVGIIVGWSYSFWTFRKKEDVRDDDLKAL